MYPIKQVNNVKLFSKIGKNKLFLAIATYILISLIFFTFFVPPFQKPDENAHFYRASALSSGQFNCQRDSNNKPYFSIQKSYYDLPDVLRFDQISFKPDSKFSKLDLKNGLNVKHSNNETVRYYSLCNTFFSGYIPNSIGLIIGDFFHKPLISFYFARLAGVFFFLSCIFISLKLIKSSYKYFILLYSITPMVLHQVSSINYDVVQLSLIPLLFSLLIKFLEEHSIKLRMFLLFLLIIFVLILTRNGYLLFSLIYLLIPYKKISNSLLRYIVITSIFFSLVAVFSFYSLKIGSEIYSFPDLVDPEIQKQVVLSDPLNFLLVILNSIKDNGSFYLESLIGVFGWVDYKLNSVTIMLYFVFAGFIIRESLSTEKQILSIKKLLLLFFIISGTIGVIFLSLYLVFTPVGYHLIIGIQGRYFLPLVPFTLFFFTQVLLKIGRQKSLLAFLVIVLLFSIVDITQSIYLRYFDFSKSSISGSIMQTRFQDYQINPGNYSTDELRTNTTIINELPTSGKKIKGFQLLIDPKTTKVTNSYKYYLKDKSCKEMIRIGYFSQVLLQEKRIYTEYFKSFDADENDLCFVIVPTNRSSTNNISLILFNNKIQFNLLND